MSSIDDRIVQMQFDNDQFEKGVAQTNSSLDSLKSHLQLNGATDGMNNIQKTADGMNLDGISDGVSHISAAFSALGVIGVNVLSDLTQKAIATGESLINQVVGPIVTGGQQRAIALQQAQFQFKGLGLNVTQTMAAALAAVKGTAYGLDEAATAAAQFGASGITAGNGLEQVLRGVAGVAAQTGRGYSDIANIFEEIAGNGRVMGQNLLELSDSGVNAAAILAKSMGTTEANVRTMVTAGKISFQQFSDAMNSAFGANAANANQTFTGALANMHAALARFGADFDTPKLIDQRNIFNALSPQIDNVTAALLPAINAFNKLDDISSKGLVSAINSINLKPLAAFAPGLGVALTNAFKALQSVLTPLKDAFAEIFPPETVSEVKGIAAALDSFTKSLILSSQSQTELKNTFAGFFAIIDIGVRIISGLVGMFASLLGYTTQGSGGILSFTGSIGQFLVKVDDAVKQGSFLNNFFTDLGKVLAVPITLLKLFAGAIETAVDAIDDLVTKKGFDSFASDTQKNFSGLITLGQFFVTVWQGVEKVWGAITGVLKPVFDALAGYVSQTAGIVENALGKLDFSTALQAINTGLFGGFLFILNGFFGNIKGALQGNGIVFVTQFKKIFNQLTTNLKALELSVDAKTIETIAISVALLAASAIALSLVNPGKLAASMGAITVSLGQLLGAFAIIQKIPTAKGFLQGPKIAATLILLAGALDLMTVAVVALSLLSWNQIVKGLTAVTVLLGEMVATSALLQKSGPGLVVTAAALVILGVALNVMAGAVAILASISWENLGKGLAAVTVLLAEMVTVATLLKSRGPGFAIAAAGIDAIAAALAVMAGVVTIFANTSWENLAKGLSGVTVLLIEMVGAVKLLSGSGPGVAIAAASMLVMAVALNALAGATEILGHMSITSLIKGLASLGIMLGIVVAALLLLDDPMVLVGAAAMAIISVAIVTLSGAMKIFGSMNWNSIAKSLVELVGSLAILAAAMIVMGNPVVLIGAAALIIAAAALVPLAASMKLLGSISWGQIGSGLTVLAAAIVILAAGGILLIPAIPGLMGVGIAIALIGAGALAAGVGISLFAAALTILIGLGGAAVTAIVTAIGGFIQQLPGLATAFALALGTFATTIATEGPEMVVALTTVLLSMLTAFNTVIPQAVIVATNFILALLNAMGVLIPQFANTGLLIIQGILGAIALHIGDIVNEGAQIVVNFINGVSNNLGKVDNAAANLVINFINQLADTINKKSSQLNSAGLKLAGAIVNGMTGGLASKVGSVVSAAEKLAGAIPAAIKNLLNINSPSKVTRGLAESAGEGIVDGLNLWGNAVTTASTALGQNAVDGVSSSLSGISAAVNDNIDVQPTIAPVMDLSNVKTGAAQIGTMLSNQTLSVGTVTADAANVNTGVNTTMAPVVQANVPTLDENGNPASTGPGVTFIQNNNSPVALSTADIYRQTKNTISLAREALAI